MRGPAIDAGNVVAKREAGAPARRRGSAGREHRTASSRKKGGADGERKRGGAHRWATRPRPGGRALHVDYVHVACIMWCMGYHVHEMVHNI